MPSLNLPILDQLAASRSVLIVGIGGGFDVFCGLPLFFHLRDRGLQVHLANYSFSDIQSHASGLRLSDTLVGVTADHPHMVIYHPELYLARRFRQARGEEVPIWAFHKTGVRPLRDNYQRLVERLQIDTLILIGCFRAASLVRDLRLASASRARTRPSQAVCFPPRCLLCGHTPTPV